MRTVRKLIGALACVALLSVFGTTTAGAQGPARCEKLARITERITEKQARIAARQADRPRAAAALQNHKPKLIIGLQDRVAKLEARCSS
jgi:hypothetical protein